MKYKIIYSKTKHGRVKLLPNMNLEIIIPFKKSNDENFEKILIKKGERLIEKFKKTKQIKTITKKHVIIFGEEILLSSINGNLEIYLKEKLYFTSLPILDKYSKTLGIKYNKIHIKNLKTKWGSCSFIQNISLNLKLIHLPLKFLEYVIIHEICHLKEKNHSKKFRDLVSKYSPNYKNIKKELKGILI